MRTSASAQTACGDLQHFAEALRVCLGGLVLAGTLWVAGYANRAERLAGLRLPAWIVLPVMVVFVLIWLDRLDLAVSCGVCTASGAWAAGMAPIRN